ncbi:hypothetical protein ACIRPT_05955 [Streptomyces sp. NPDC101227]|uniref:hypothetical protein n=1 Tax=Streptomyces sp. NPDC101227 TaxID=3366136 RepID=UPI0037FBBB09
MMINAKIGMALVGGYLLGRTKKAKMAIGLGMFLAGKRLNLDPRELGRLAAESPVLGPLGDQARKELVDATKSAATSALTHRMSGLADSLHERTTVLKAVPHPTDDAGPSEDGGPSDDGEPSDDARPSNDARPSDEEEPARQTEPRTEVESEERAPRRKAPAGSSAKQAKGGRSTASRRAASGPSGKDQATSRGRRTSASPARNAASGARKRASGAARTAADRGGDDG